MGGDRVKTTKSFNGKDFSMEKSTILVFAVSMLTNVCNYAFQIITGRFLEVPVYGELNTLLSGMTVIGLFGGMLANMATRYSARYAVEGSKASVKSLFIRMMKMGFLLFLLLMFIGTLLSGFLQRAFHFDTRLIVLCAFLSTGISIFLSITNGILQGVKSFIPAQLTTFFSSIGKSTFTVVFLLAGFGIFGVLGASMMGIVIAFIFGFFCLHHYWKDERPLQAPLTITLRDMMQYGSQVYITQMGLSLLTSGDMLLVKLFFDPQTAGLYSSAMVIGKISTYITGVISFVLLPTVAAKAAQGRQTKEYYKKSLLYSLIISVGFLIVCKPVFSILGRPLFGEAYEDAINFIVPVAMLMVPLTLISMTVSYQTAHGNLRFLNLVLGVGIIALVVGAACFHASVQQIMTTLTTILVMMAVVLVAYVLHEQKQIEVNL